MLRRIQNHQTTGINDSQPVQTQVKQEAKAVELPFQSPQHLPQNSGSQGPNHFSQLGAMMGKMGKNVAFALLGANMVLGLSGCATSGPTFKDLPAVHQPDVAQKVRFFSPAADGQWRVSADPQAQVPARMGQILDVIAKSRFVVDGQPALVLDPEVGSRVHVSPWTTSELGDLVKSLKSYVESGEFAQVSQSVAASFFDEVIPVISEVGPSKHAGYGFAAAKLNSIGDQLIALEKQLIEAQAKFQ